MSERTNHPEWENPYIVDPDQVIIDLIRNIRRSAAAAGEQLESKTAEEN